MLSCLTFQLLIGFFQLRALTSQDFILLVQLIYLLVFVLDVLFQLLDLVDIVSTLVPKRFLLLLQLRDLGSFKLQFFTEFSDLLLETVHSILFFVKRLL